MERMLADYFTKPLNGTRFRFLREIIMGHFETDKLYQHALKERVENDVNENKFNISAR